jgi:two-component system response regulator FlrC
VFTQEAEACLSQYHWPGNVRELTNLVQRAAVLSDGAAIEVEHLIFEAGPPRVASVELEPDDQVVSLEEDLKAREREVIFEALRSGNGSREAAAARLGISPRTLRHKLARIREEGAEIPGEVMRSA